MVPSRRMTRWCVSLILCLASAPRARPHNTAEAATVLDQFILGHLPLNTAINRIQFLGAEDFVSSELVFAMRRAPTRRAASQLLELLSYVGARRPDVEHLFLMALESDEPQDVLSGARGVGQIKSPRAFEPLVALLSNRLLGLRREAARSLVRIGNRKAGGVLLQAARVEADVELRVLMIHSAALTGNQRQVPALKALLGDHSESTRLASARALCVLGSAECPRFATKLLASGEAEAPFQAVMLFEGAPLKLSRPFLLPVLLHADPRLRARAARLLVQSGDEAQLDWLVVESAKASGEVRSLYEAELEQLRLQPSRRQAILQKAGVQ